LPFFIFKVVRKLSERKKERKKERKERRKTKENAHKKERIDFGLVFLPS
jgi:hypothetical protein